MTTGAAKGARTRASRINLACELLLVERLWRKLRLKKKPDIFLLGIGDVNYISVALINMPLGHINKLHCFTFPPVYTI